MSVEETPPPGVEASVWHKFLAHMRGETEQPVHDDTHDVKHDDTHNVTAPSESSSPATSPDPVDPEAPAPAPPASAGPGIGAMVAFHSDYGTQYGQVSRKDTVLGEPASCVAWATGGESGPIADTDLEVL